MRTRTLIKRAAAVACSAALIANPAMAIAAEGVSNQPVTQVAAQATASHRLELHNYEVTNSDVFAKLRAWWSTGQISDYESYRLTSGSTTYTVNRGNELFSLPSGTYAVEGGIVQGVLDMRWSNLGTFTVHRYWDLGVAVDGAPEGAGGIKVGLASTSSGTIKVNEGVAVTAAPIAVPNYDVSVTLDGAPVALDANGSFVIPARSGQDGMRDSDIDVTYSKREAILMFNEFGSVSYNPNKEELLGEILDKIFENGASLYYDLGNDALQKVDGLTKDDLSVSFVGDALNAGEQEVLLQYRGTLGGVESIYAPQTYTYAVKIDPATLTLGWAQQLGEVTGAYKGQVDGVISQDDAQTFDFAAADAGVPTATFKTLFYRGVGDGATLLGEDAPSKPGLYTEVVTMTDSSCNYFARPLSRTFAIEKKAEDGPVTPVNPGSGSIDPTGPATKPSDEKPSTKKATKKAKATLPKTGDDSMVVPVTVGVAGAAALTAAVVARKRRDN